ncbi:MAG: hypothetical protein QM831_33880 [Kofleriaceae bacterium]
MKLLAPFIKRRNISHWVTNAHGAGPNRLNLAFEIFDHDTDEALTTILSVDLTTLAVDILHEAPGSGLDYQYRDDWHGLVTLESLTEIVDGKVTTIAPKKKDRLYRVARSGSTTYVGGERGDYLGIVMKVAGKKLVDVFDTAVLGDRGAGITALAVGPSGTIYASGNIQDADSVVLFRGKTKFSPTKLGLHEAYAICETPKGKILVGARDVAIVDGKVIAEFPHGKVLGTCMFGGTEYWLAHDYQLSLHTGTKKLARKARVKYLFVSYRTGHGAPEATLSSSADWLVLTNKDRLHLFDGKKWSQLAVQLNPKKLIKRLASPIKR